MRAPRYHLFFVNRTAPAQLSPLSLHDPLPIRTAAAPCTCISRSALRRLRRPHTNSRRNYTSTTPSPIASTRRNPTDRKSTSELQSPCNLVCRLLLEKKKNKVSDRHE